MLLDQPVHLLGKLPRLLTHARRLEVLNGDFQMGDPPLEFFRYARRRRREFRAPFELPDDLTHFALLGLGFVRLAGCCQAAHSRLQLLQASDELLALRAGLVSTLTGPAKLLLEFTRLGSHPLGCRVEFVQGCSKLPGLFGLVVSLQSLQLALDNRCPFAQFTTPLVQLSQAGFQFRPFALAQLPPFALAFWAAQLPANRLHPPLDFAEGTLEFLGLCVLAVAEPLEPAADVAGLLLQLAELLRQAVTACFSLASLSSFTFPGLALFPLPLLTLAGLGFLALPCFALPQLGFRALPRFALAGFTLFLFSQQDNLAFDSGGIAGNRGGGGPAKRLVVGHGVGATRAKQAQHHRGEPAGP